MDKSMNTKQSNEKGEILRHVMRNWATGVAVLTTVCEGEKGGITVNSFTSLSLDPPLVLVNVAKDNPLHDMFQQCRVFGLSVLGEAQRETANLFAGFGKRIRDKFSEVKTFTLSTGVPFITGSNAFLDCEVFSILKLPQSVLIIGEVLDGRSEGNKNPLLYFNRDYTKVSPPKIEN
jgi:flavin reductase (DIM6/NTAB) family NADH-FMN oxidoreductase RutF